MAGYYLAVPAGRKRVPVERRRRSGGVAAMIAIGVRVLVLQRRNVRYQQISGVTDSHVWANLASRGLAGAVLGLTAGALMPFLALGWKKMHPSLKRLALYLLPVLFSCRACFFSWLRETRNFMPLVFVLAVNTSIYVGGFFTAGRGEEALEPGYGLSLERYAAPVVIATALIVSLSAIFIATYTRGITPDTLVRMMPAGPGEQGTDYSAFGTLGPPLVGGNPTIVGRWAKNGFHWTRGGMPVSGEGAYGSYVSSDADTGEDSSPGRFHITAEESILGIPIVSRTWTIPGCPSRFWMRRPARRWRLSILFLSRCTGGLGW